MKNINLHQARQAQKDEFYTHLSDIESELEHYKAHFKNKVVYCNCDNHLASNFVFYFASNFDRLGLKKLISTSYNLSNTAFPRKTTMMEYKGLKYLDPATNFKFKYLAGDGSFQSEECIELLKQADIVVTNPPFSLFREYVAQLMEYNKKFLIIGNQNAITYKEIFPLIKDNKLWLGNGFKKGAEFTVPNSEYYKTKKDYNPETGLVRFRNIRWFTNLETDQPKQDLQLECNYSPEAYPKYDNYDAIEVSKFKDIPRDYSGVMGVPITFLDKYNPDQFDIIRFRTGKDDKDLAINGKYPYFRILIRRKSNENK